MVLTHRERVEPRKTQAQLSTERFAPDRHPVNKPSPGVYARNNAVDMPALLPDGSIAEDSVPGPLRLDGDIRDADRLAIERGRAPARPRGGHRRLLGRDPLDASAGGSGMNPTNYLVLSAILFSIGAAGVLVRRNAIVVFMCIELMLNASNLAFVTFARTNGTLDGQVVAFFVMVVAAAEVVIGLAIIVTIFRTRNSASVDEPNLLKL